MKTNVLCALIAGLALITATGCKPFKVVRGDGNVVTREISIGDYNKIEVSHSLKLIYSQSEESPALKVTVDENILEIYDIKVSGGKLQIKPKKEFEWAYFKPTEFTIVAQSKELSSVELAGSTDFELNGLFTSEKLKIDLAGSGTININDSAFINHFDIDMAGSSTLNALQLNGRKFNGDIAGSGKLNLGGVMENAVFDIAGSGTVHAFDLQVDGMTCDIAGSGNVEISVNNSINVSVAGSGRVKYRGNPQNIKKDIAGLGSVVKVD
ncbi:MAG: DUF2807 domain-containing protein [Tannerellaceae bacterium]|jgi:hypothetical protein|nr:DUF2807 domain-containing protein [Tannerellaceae bacterium]